MYVLLNDNILILHKWMEAGFHYIEYHTSAQQSKKRQKLLEIRRRNMSSLFLVSYVGERPWWPIQSPNKGRKKEATESLLQDSKSRERERGSDQVY